MDEKSKEKIEKTVREILEEADMSATTEYQIRKTASEKLNINLSESPYKAFVRTIVESFLYEQKEKFNKKQQDEEEKDVEQKEEEEEEGNVDGKEYDDEGNLVICKLSAKRIVTIQDFRGKTLVSIREYYYKEGKELPTSKGISMTEEQWSIFSKNIPAIENAVKKMQSRV